MFYSFVKMHVTLLDGNGSIWAGVHLCHSEGDRLHGSEWMSFMLSHRVSEGDWFSSGCGVPSCQSCLGDYTFLASWNGVSPATPSGASCFA